MQPYLILITHPASIPEFLNVKIKFDIFHWIFRLGTQISVTHVIMTQLVCENEFLVQFIQFSKYLTAK